MVFNPIIKKNNKGLIKPVVDISENEIKSKYPDVLEQLLRDHTTKKNIFWATNNYQDLGKGYSYQNEIAFIEKMKKPMAE